MKINLDIKPGLRIPAFYLFFIMTSNQTGVGILGVPKHIFSQAHHDSWISILIAFIYMLIIVAVTFATLNQYENTDLFGIQVDIFGKWIGKLLGTIFIIFFIAQLLSVLLTYIKMIQIFIYPTIPSFMMALILLIIIVYSVLGGIRVVVGVVFIFFLLSSWVLILLYKPITSMEYTHFLPLFDASFPELLRGAKETSYTFIGVEILFFVYPFIENKKKAKLPAYLSVTYTTLFVLITTIISIGYYSPHDFEKMDWPVLTLFKSISFTFLERFDYLVVIEWMMVSLTTMILVMWVITYGMKRLYMVRQKTTLYSVAIGLFIISHFINYEYKVQDFVNIVSKIGFWIVFVYPLILLPIVWIKKKWQKYKVGVK